MVEKKTWLELEKLESSKFECGGHNNLNISVAEEANDHEGDLYVIISCSRNVGNVSLADSARLTRCGPVYLR
jgi:hypothetical protein